MARRVLILVGIASLAFLVARGQGCGGPLEAGTKAPAFSAPDSTGRTTWTLESFQGRPFVLVFFATWCPSCRDELPMVDRVAAGKRPVLLVSDEPAGQLGPFLAARKITVPTAASAGSVLRSYNVRVLPTAVLVDADGVVQYAGEGGHAVSTALRRLAELEAAAPGSAG